MKLIRHITNVKLAMYTSIFLTLFHNIAFFRNIAKIYPPAPENIAFLGSIAVVFASLMVIVISLASSKYTAKPFIILILTVSALASYFMDSYNIIIDAEMIRNVLETNTSESMDLFNIRLFAYVLLIGILPSLFVWKIKIHRSPLKSELAARLKVTGVSMIIIIALVFSFNRFYTSFFREHKPLRYYSNPTAWIYAAGKFAGAGFNIGSKPVVSIGTDATIPETDQDRELIILVLGEAVRADRMSLNGYSRETNPRLAKEDVISFTNMHSCGTSTAVSVPCMFSIFGKEGYTSKKGKSTENLLDVLSHAGINVLWRDNNSSSKGTAVRVPYEDFRHPDRNPVCDSTECRDEGMLAGLQDYIDGIETGDIFIVLHQMGNHGPAYYKRYPAAFEKFTPVCRTNQLEECSKEEIGNAYDNAVLYTDYFLAKTIELLKQNSDKFETAMLYFSDHGESLGEKGIYLHGLPYFMAPDEQTHIAAIMWFGNRFILDRNALQAKAGNEFSQDNLFHTILGLMEIETGIYNQSLDIINAETIETRS